MRPSVKIGVFSLYGVLQLLSLAKWVYAKPAYPLVYPFRNWCRLRVYNYEKIPNLPYTKMRVSKFTYLIAKFLWYHFDDDVIPQGADFYVNNHCKGDIGVDMLTTEGWKRIGENSSDVGRVTDPLRAFCCAFRWNAWRNPCYNVNYSLLSNKSEIHLVEAVYSTGTPWDERCRIHRLSDGRFRDGWRAFLGKKFNYWRTDKGQNRFTFTYAKELKVLTGIICFVYKPFYGSIVCIEIKLGWNPDFNGRMTGTVRFPVGKGA